MSSFDQAADRINAAVEKAEIGSEILSQVANGDEFTEVPTTSGPVPSLKKWQKDNIDLISGGVIARVDKAILSYPNYAAASAAAATLPDGQAVEVAQDETRAGARTRYKVQAGALVFVVNLDQAMVDLANDTDPAKGAGMVGYFPDWVGAVGRTVQDKLRDHVTPFDFMTAEQIADVRSGTALVNVTAAVQAAINSGLPVECKNGTYLVDTLYFPNSPSDANPVGGRFVGSPNVIFQQATANTALFRKVASAGRCYGWEIGPFVVKPKSGSSSTISAIYTTGFTGCAFNRIEGRSNGAAGFYALFDVAAAPYLSYFNTFNNPTLVGASGYTKVFRFNNNGTGAGGNSNANIINSPVIYNNTGLTTAIDANASYATTINAPYIEANAGALAISMAPGLTVIGGALEANGKDFDYGNPSNPANNTTVIGTYLGTANTVNFGGLASYGNIWLNVQEAGGEATWINTVGVGNQKIRPIYTASPNTPTLTQSSGTAGVIASRSSAIKRDWQQMSRSARLAVGMQFTPANLGAVSLLVTPPSGWTIADLSFGIVDAVTGISVMSASTIDGKCWFTPTTTNVHFVDYFVELMK